jgi:hypothetical protein
MDIAMKVVGLGDVIAISKMRDSFTGSADPVRTNHELKVRPVATGV